MKLTTKALKQLINEVMSEGLLTEATFNVAMEKINKDKKPFFILSANRGERGTKHSKGNVAASKELEDFFRANNLSFTKVDGGYTEFKKEKDPVTGEIVKDEDGKDVFATDDKGEKIPEEVEEISYLVFGDDPHYGSNANRVTSVLELFEIAKQACRVDSQNPQEAFTFGYPLTDSVTGETEMFIALYTPDAPMPGRRHVFKDWGGPYMDAEHFPSTAQGPYTAMRKSRMTFTEEQLEEVKQRKVRTVNEGRKKHADIARLERELLMLKGKKWKK